MIVAFRRQTLLLPDDCWYALQPSIPHLTRSSLHLYFKQHSICYAAMPVRLVEETVCERFTDERPKRIIGDKAFDSDPLDEKLHRLGTELIAPHRANRRKPKTQDGRKLRRYQRRWKIERLFAWLQNFRRIVVRYEYHADNYLGFVQLACMLILLRNYF